MIIDSIKNKQKILNKFLKICEFDGWNDESLARAVTESGFEENIANLIFEDGAQDIAIFFISDIDKKMTKEIASINLENLKIREKIKALVKLRLELNKNHKLAIKQLIKFYSSPKKFLYALKNSYKTADLIWYSIGDQSTDFNFYTKRIILSKVYVKTLLFFIDDDSKNNQKTWEFLDEQIEKVMKFGKMKGKVKKCLEKVTTLSQELESKSPKDLLKDLPFIRLFK